MKSIIYKIGIPVLIYIIVVTPAILIFGINKPKEIIEETIVEEETIEEKAIGNPINYYIGDWIDMRASEYCACAICCDVETGITASGAHVQAHHTIAAPSWLAFGTWVEIKSDIPGVSGYYRVEDRGGAIKGDRLDIYVEDHYESDVFGIHPVKMRIISENLIFD